MHQLDSAWSLFLSSPASVPSYQRTHTPLPACWCFQAASAQTAAPASVAQRKPRSPKAVIPSEVSAAEFSTLRNRKEDDPAGIELTQLGQGKVGATAAGVPGPDTKGDPESGLRAAGAGAGAGVGPDGNSHHSGDDPVSDAPKDASPDTGPYTWKGSIIGLLPLIVAFLAILLARVIPGGDDLLNDDDSRLHPKVFHYAPSFELNTTAVPTLGTCQVFLQSHNFEVLFSWLWLPGLLLVVLAAFIPCTSKPVVVEPRTYVRIGVPIVVRSPLLLVLLACGAIPRYLGRVSA